MTDPLREHERLSRAVEASTADVSRAVARLQHTAHKQLTGTAWEDLSRTALHVIQQRALVHARALLRDHAWGVLAGALLLGAWLGRRNTASTLIFVSARPLLTQHRSIHVA